MAENEKKIVENIAAAMQCLPEEKQQYFLGYAEGIAAMAGLVKAQNVA